MKLKAATQIKKFFKKLFPKKKKAQLVAIILSIIVILVLSFLSYTIAYANRVYPNVYLGGEKLSGFTKEKVRENLKFKIENSKLEKITLTYEDKKWEISLKSINFQYNLNKSVEKVWSVGRKSSFLQSLKEQVLVLFWPEKLGMEFSFDEEQVRAEIDDIARILDIPERVISFALINGEIVSIPPKEGRKVIKEETFYVLKKALGDFQDESPVVVVKIIPKIKGENPEQIKEARTKFKKIVSDNLVFGFGDKQFKAGPEEIQKWIKFVEEPSSSLGYVLDVKLNEETTNQFINSIASQIDKEPKDAKLTIVDGRAVVFQPHEDGYRLDKEDTFNKIEEILLGKNSDQVGKREIELRVQTLKPAIRTETINELGIRELIGEGISYFKGSPANRIHNIRVGASLFNGVLIKPGEIFSFNKILGEVSASRGFLPELVIKEDRLIPETGGGLCQVSTTMFRAALYSGLDILERTPHSFRVRYYEPPVGLDATVYQPKPDLKFRNDTPGYILVQTKIERSKLTFQFYGTKDGRTVEVRGPYTSGYTSPGPPVYIDDPSLPPGTVKQIEKAVPGLTATIYWTVKKDGKILHQKTFVSKYVAWSAKYKRGPSLPPSSPPPPQTPISPPTPIEPFPSE